MILIVSITLIVTATISYIYTEVAKWDLVMMPKVMIESIDFTGKTKDQVISTLFDAYGNTILEKNVEIIAPEKIYYVSYRELNVKYNIMEVVDKAYEYGRNENFFYKYLLIRKGEKQEFDLNFTYDESPINKVISEMEKAINKESINATIGLLYAGRFEVKDEIKGVKLDSLKLLSDINSKIQSESKDLTLIAPIEETNAAITGEDLRAINANVGSYSTSFFNSSVNRINNITLATEVINGTVLMPEEVFSFNETLGARTESKGYKNAHIILDGEYVDGLGGGICQVSSTLYNAALLAGLEIVERHHHTYPSTYVPLGQDASVDYGNLDIKIRNNEEYPIYIYGYTKNKTVTFIIYSNNELNKIAKVVVNDIYKIYQPKYKIIEDPYLRMGVERIEKKAHTGYKVNVYRVFYQNNIKVLTETVSSDYFMPFEGVKRVGTKKN
jgi:vancomycin resistance protein YoaR